MDELGPAVAMDVKIGNKVFDNDWLLRELHESGVVEQASVPAKCETWISNVQRKDRR